MSFNTQNIRSIGWLNGINNSIRLTPVFEGEQMPRTVTISKDEFESIRDNDDMMKQKAVDMLNA
jgi:hypothetical protein